MTMQNHYWNDFADRIWAATKASGLNPRQIAAQINMPYDHVSKVLKGSVLPGDRMLEVLCTVLGLNFVFMRDLARNAHTPDDPNEGAIQ
jgi:ribosome-binding protein aMBF1 (putative translation factor)